MKTSPKPPAEFISRNEIQEERLDAIRQRDENQQIINETQNIIQRAQVQQQQAQAALLVASGMIQQNDAYLKMLDKQPLEAVPSAPQQETTPAS